MKKNIALLLLLAMVLSHVTSCATASVETTGAEGEGIPSETTTAVETVPETVDLYADLGAADYEGYTIRILNSESFKSYMISEEQTGEVVNDAVYAANAKVMELANVVLSQIIVDSPNVTFKNCVNAGDDAFDMAVDHDLDSANRQMAGNYMLNLLTLPHIDFSQPWWPQFTVEATTFNDQMYMFSNYSSYLGNWYTRVCMANLDAIRDNGLEDPYQLVYENKWTIDKWIEMSEDLYIDSNGNGTKEYSDFYGFSFTGDFYCWLEAWNVEVFKKGSDGNSITIDVENENLVNTVEKIYNWFHDSQGVYFSATENGAVSKGGFKEDSYINLFANGNCLFTYGVIGRLLQSLMESDVTYAILPMPMMNESVGKYYSGTTDRTVSIPTTCQNVDMIGYVIEAMAISGYEMILPAYCDTALKGRYSVDMDSSAMLDIIFENRILGFSYLYSNHGNFPWMLNNLMKSNSFDYASYVAKNMNSNEAWAEKIVAAYQPE